MRLPRPSLSPFLSRSLFSFPQRPQRRVSSRRRVRDICVRMGTGKRENIFPPDVPAERFRYLSRSASAGRNFQPSEIRSTFLSLSLFLSFFSSSPRRDRPGRELPVVDELERSDEEFVPLSFDFSRNKGDSTRSNAKHPRAFCDSSSCSRNKIPGNS